MPLWSPVISANGDRPFLAAVAPPGCGGDRLPQPAQQSPAGRGLPTRRAAPVGEPDAADPVEEGVALEIVRCQATEGGLGGPTLALRFTPVADPQALRQPATRSRKRAGVAAAARPAIVGSARKSRWPVGKGWRSATRPPISALTSR